GYGAGMGAGQSTNPSAAGLERVGPVADAILYEGYLLYPYRRSSAKNKVRWQFGVLAPRQWIEAQGPVDTGVAGSAESWFQQTECLVDGAVSATVRMRLRFLQFQAKSLEQRGPDGGYAVVDQLEVNGCSYYAFDEAVPREHDVVVSLDELGSGARTVTVTAPEGVEVEELTDESGVTAGRVVRRRWPVSALVTVQVEVAEAPFRLRRLRVCTENTGAVSADAPRTQALRYSLIAAHTVLGVDGAAFVSLLDPPEWAAGAARACANVHTFPVLAGDEGDRNLLLSSPIILYDYPKVAPESQGDLFDATEIDEILSLRTLALSEGEKREVRSTDPRGAALLDRVDSMPPELMSRLHGAVRSLRPVAGEDDDEDETSVFAASAPWWDPGADTSVSPETDTVVVDGVELAKGSRVRLHPRSHGTDAHDMFLEDRTGQVNAVFLDVDGSRQLAVTIEGDPAAELNEWYGRFRYFAPDEVEPVTGDS
ncbi:MAG: hypothetical protein ACRDMV_09605, partial [Streptosporangiales bacterium]